jgi:ribosome-binding ATPase YchF (GTP1/OBG family)
VYLVNLSPGDYARKKNKWLGKIAEWVAGHGGGKIIPFSGRLEADLVDMPEDEQKKRACVCHWF